MNFQIADKEISFTVSPEERELIEKIVTRATHAPWGYVVNPLSMTMDLAATHANGCPLRFQDLLEADDLNFVHDVCGIARHIDRRTGKLMDCFIPRFAARQ